MDPVTALYIAGSVFSYLGQRKADKAQAEAELLNARFFKEQQELAAFEGARELDIFQRESEAVIGGAQASIARSGVAFAGSAVSAIAQGRLQARKEKAAIIKSTESRVKLAGIRSKEATDKAKQLQSAGGEQAIGGLLNLGAALYGRNSKTGGTANLSSNTSGISFEDANNRSFTGRSVQSSSYSLFDRPNLVGRGGF